VVLVPTSLAAPAAQCGTCGRTHVVQHGDTLIGIAAHFGVSPHDLAMFNKLANPNCIRIGQRLMIPDGKGKMDDHKVVVDHKKVEEPKKAPVKMTNFDQMMGGFSPMIKQFQSQWPGKWHTVCAGESLTSIARKWGVNPMTISMANGLTNPNHIWFGQKLWVPSF